MVSISFSLYFRNFVNTCLAVGMKNLAKLPQEKKKNIFHNLLTDKELSYLLLAFLLKNAILFGKKIALDLFFAIL